MQWENLFFLRPRSLLPFLYLQVLQTLGISKAAAQGIKRTSLHTHELRNDSKSGYKDIDIPPDHPGRKSKKSRRQPKERIMNITQKSTITQHFLP